MAVMQGLTPYNLRIVSEVLGGKSYPLGLLERLEPKPVIVDLGAHIGAFSLACLTLRPDARVVAVEPDPESCAALRRNVDGRAVELHACALSERDGAVTLFRGARDGVASSTSPGAMVSTREAVTVEGRGIAGFLEDVTRAHGRVDLLKSDMEGAEWHLLQVLPRVATIPVVLLEHHSASFLERFLPALLGSHVIHSGALRFPHRGELALLRKDLVLEEQRAYEIRP